MSAEKRAPQGFTVRGLRQSDAAEVARLFVACDLVQDVTAPMHEAYIADEWARPRFDIHRDAWAIRDETQNLVSYAEVWDTGSSEGVEAIGVVHPNSRNRGLGSLVVGLAEARARELVRLRAVGSLPFRTVVSGSDPAAQRLLTEGGYRPVRHHLHMKVDAGAAPSPTPTPPRMAIRSPGPGEAREVHRTLTDAFADHWGTSPVDFDEWWSTKKARSDFDPSLWLVATEDHRVVGVLTAVVTEGLGWIDELGVVVDQRGRGIGKALLTRSFELLAARGARYIKLNVDAGNETGATKLYEGAGMRACQEYVFFEKVLPAAGGGVDRSQ